MCFHIVLLLSAIEAHEFSVVASHPTASPRVGVVEEGEVGGITTKLQVVGAYAGKFGTSSNKPYRILFKTYRSYFRRIFHTK